MENPLTSWVCQYFRRTYPTAIEENRIKHSFTIIIKNELKILRRFPPIYKKRNLQFYKAVYASYSITSFEFYSSPGRWREKRNAFNIKQGIRRGPLLCANTQWRIHQRPNDPFQTSRYPGSASKSWENDRS